MASCGDIGLFSKKMTSVPAMRDEVAPAHISITVNEVMKFPQKSRSGSSILWAVWYECHAAREIRIPRNLEISHRICNTQKNNSVNQDLESWSKPGSKLDKR